VSSGEVVSVIVAAGAGRRLGGVAKALLPSAEAGVTFLARIAATASAAGAGRAVVVVGPPHGARVAAEARRLELEVAENPDPDRGMSSSVAIGFGHAAERFASAVAGLLWPVDHARVEQATVADLVRGASGDAILVPTWRGRGGHPTAFGIDHWAALAGCDRLARGARSVLDAAAAHLRRVPVADPGVVADVDHPADLA
jgi:CTP:molybdopterin cytidylyltransferase MocA